MEQKVMMALCVKCNEIFTLPARRGRPPKYCDSCLGVAKADADVSEEVAYRVFAERKQAEQEAKEAAALARVIKLEQQLKMFGRHISQHRQEE